MEQAARLSISGENNTVQVGPRNRIIRNGVPMDVSQRRTQVSQRQGHPGVAQLPDADHSAPAVDISGSGHSVQTGKMCLQMPAGADPHQVSQIAAVRPINGGGNFSPKVKISGRDHDIQHGELCIKVVSPTAVPGQMQAPLSQASASVNGAIASLEPTTEGMEEEGGEANDYDQSQHVLRNVHIRPPPPPLSSLEVDGRGDQTDLKIASTPQLSFPHQESATGTQGQGDNPAKLQLLSSEERATEGNEPPTAAKVIDDAAAKPDVAIHTAMPQKEGDLKVSSTEFAGKPEPFEDDEISNLPAFEHDISVRSSQPASDTVISPTSTSLVTTLAESTLSRSDPSPVGDNEISNASSYPEDSLGSTLKATAAEPVEMSEPLSQSQWSNRSTGSLSTRTLTSSSQSLLGDKARPVGPQRSTGDEIWNDSHQDIDKASSDQRTDVLTSAVATKVSTSLEESQQDWRTTAKVDEGDLGKEGGTPSSVPVKPTKAKNSTSARSHILGKQRREGVGFAEHHLASFYSSETAAAAAALRSGFTDNEISNDAIYDIQTDSVPEKKETPPPEREQKMENTLPSGVTAMNASDSQHVEIKEQSLEDLAHHQQWEHQFSDDEDVMANDDCGIENPGISKALSRDSPPSMPGIDSHIRSLDVLQSKGTLNSMSASLSLPTSVVERVNRMEQVLDDVKQMTSEGQQTLESRLDRLEGMVEKLLQIVTTQKKGAPTTPSGSAPSSLQGDVHYGASGGEDPTYSELPSGSVEGFRKEETARTDFYEQKRGYPKETFGEEPSSYRQYGRAGKTRKEDFLSPEEELQPLRTMLTFKGDASVRPKQRPSTSRPKEDVDMGRTGTKEVHTETTKEKKGVLAETTDTYGDTRNAMKQEAGTVGQDGGIRAFTGGLRQDSGGRTGIETAEVELEYNHLEDSTRPKQPAGKEFSQTLRPQPSALDEEDLEEDSVVDMRRALQTFSAHTLVILKNLHIMTNVTQVTSDPVTFRLATALEEAMFPGSRPKPPLAKGHATVLVLDNSESMKGKPLQQAMKFANDFLNGIEKLAARHKCDENVAIVTIGGGAKVIHHFSNDYNGLRSALEGVRAEGRSPFKEAILVSFGLVYVLRTVVAVGRAFSIRPRVIFVTDGKITDESQPQELDAPAASPKAKAELIQLLKSILAAPIFPRPFFWVPVHGADRTFMDAMADTPGNQVSELEEVAYLTHSYRLQIITGLVMNCILDLPEGPDDLIEAIHSHIEVFQPNLPEVFKDLVFRSVVKHLSERHRRILASNKTAGERRAAERKAAEKRDGR